MSTRSVLPQSISPSSRVFSAKNNMKSDEHLKRVIKNFEPIDGKEDARDTLFLILPNFDHNGGFTLGNGEQIDENISRLAGKYKIKWVRAGSLNEVTDAMKKVDEISHLLIYGHGNPFGVALSASESNPMNDSNSLTVSNIGMASFPHLSNRAHILFNSCSTGAGAKLNIAKKMSMLFHKATCMAPNEDSFSDLTWVHINSEGPNLIQLNKDSSKFITKIFRNGRARFVTSYNPYEGVHRRQK